MRVRVMIAALALAVLACAAPGGAEEVVEDLAGDTPTIEATEPFPTPVGDPQPTPTQAGSDEAGDDAAPPEADSPSQGQAENACSHPYFPVIEGAAWTYQSAVGSEPPETYNVTYQDVTGDSFTYVQTWPDGSVRSEWQCSGEGGLVQTEYGQGQVTTSGGGIELETLSFDGINFPAPQDFVPGATWQASYTAAAEVQGTEIVYDIVMDYVYTNDEEITVPAGTFTAARVESIITQTGGGVDLTFNTVSWYVEGIGLVDNESETFGFESYYELVSYELP
ncbi:MAG: hypothetical protein GYB64_17390 [Chloroflexi bacterium]|nr:hypothetical protein [Chloroflexota bacterium]